MKTNVQAEESKILQTMLKFLLLLSIFTNVQYVSMMILCTATFLSEKNHDRILTFVFLEAS